MEASKHWFPDLDILSYADEGIRELMLKVNFRIIKWIGLTIVLF